MSFQLAPMLEEDIPAFAILDERAMANYAMARAMEDPNVPRRVMAEALTRKDWGKSPSSHWMKVTDSRTGDLAAVALWIFRLDSAPAPPSTAADAVAAPTEDHAAPSEADEEPRVAPPPESLSAVEPVAAKKDGASLMKEMRRYNEDFRREHIGCDPFAELAVLVTDPKYQCQGCGSMLVKWGCDKADEHRLPSMLQASPAGYKIYPRFGFEIRKVIEFDLRPWGIEETTVRRHMYRPAKRP